MDHNNCEINESINNEQIDYKNLIPRQNGFVMKFIKKDGL
jgi:hypothetical protein